MKLGKTREVRSEGERAVARPPLSLLSWCRSSGEAALVLGAAVLLGASVSSSASSALCARAEGGRGSHGRAQARRRRVWDWSFWVSGVTGCEAPAEPQAAVGAVAAALGVGRGRGRPTWPPGGVRTAAHCGRCLTTPDRALARVGAQRLIPPRTWLKPQGGRLDGGGSAHALNAR